MAKRQYQGVAASEELARQLVIRDARPLSRVVGDALRSAPAVGIATLVSAMLVAVFPALFDVLPVAFGLYLLIAKGATISLPAMKPMWSGELDPNDRNPSTKQPNKGEGIAFFGNRDEDMAEFWYPMKGLLRHVFILGTTGAGKTEGLVSILINALVWSSGFFYSDGKGDVKLFASLFSAARIFGREDDIFCVNFMTGNADASVRRADKLSNTYNPYIVGSASSLVQLTVNLMDASGSGKGGDMWQGRAISFIGVVLPCLVDKRDQGGLLLHVGEIRAHLPFVRLYDMMEDPHVREENREKIAAFFKDVPGFRPEKKKDQSNTFFEQYGYQQMQFTRILSSLADTYGHIFKSDLPEVNLRDAVVNRRMLITLLPALELSRAELGNLGKIVVAGLKGMMGGNLGNRLEGTKREILDSRATNAPTPYFAVFDEFGYYMPEDTALMWAQARSLNFSLVVAGQDIQAFFRTSREETMAVFSNCNLKIIGKLEDPKDTWELIKARAGTAKVVESDGYEADDGIVGTGLRPGRGARIVTADRVSLADLLDQVEGEVHVLEGSRITRGSLFYAAPKPAADYRLNHFVKVRPVSREDALAMMSESDAMAAFLTGDGRLDMTTHRDPFFRYVATLEQSRVGRHLLAQRKGLEYGIALLVSYDVAPVIDPAGEVSGGGVQNTHKPAAVEPDSTRSEAVGVEESVDEFDVDRLPLESINVFERHPAMASDSSFDEGALYATAAADSVAVALGRAYGFDSVLKGRLDAQAIGDGLSELGIALRATREEATVAAREVMSTAASATTYPPTPKLVVGDDAEDAMEEALDRMQRLSERTSE